MRVINSGVIFWGGRALHPLLILAVTVFWSGWESLACSPFSPCISHGLNPVCAMRSMRIERIGLAEAMSISTFSLLGGWIVIGSGV